MTYRIRYTATADGCLISTRTVVTNHGEVLVKYNPDNKVVHIILANDTDRVVDTFVGTTDHQLKRDIKKRLINLGANFTSEERKKNGS